MLGTSGQPSNDLVKFVGEQDRLILLENMLNWRHIAPTTPHHTGCYPFNETDPFIIEECPHVFFAGNQPNFASKVVEGSGGQRVLLLSLPSFEANAVIALVNLSTLKCTKVQFGSPDVLLQR